MATMMKEDDEMTSMMTIPTGMRASVLVAPGKIEIRTVEVPRVDPHSVLIRVEAVGVCGSDTHFYRSGKIGDLVVKGPVVLGHETAGTIVTVGEAVPKSRIGERVSIEPQRPCRRCNYCRIGHYNQCPDIEFYGAYPIDGSFSEYVSIPADFAFSLPDSLGILEGALIEPLGVAVYAAQTAHIQPGDTALIAGAGPIGLLLAQVLDKFGAAHVILSDPAPERRAVASALTNAEVMAPCDIRDEPCVDVFLDASGAPSAIHSGVLSVKKRGRVVLVGMGMDEVPMPLSVIQHREIQLTGIYRYAHSWPLAIELADSGELRLKELITGTFTLDEVEDALLASSRDANAIKSVVLPFPID